MLSSLTCPPPCPLPGLTRVRSFTKEDIDLECVKACFEEAGDADPVCVNNNRGFNVYGAPFL